MSGKHDKKLDDEQSAKLLLTGPIVIRGLGRSVKDALVPGKPSRHRAFIAGAPENDGTAIDAAQPVPIEDLLEAQTGVSDERSAPEPTEAVVTQSSSSSESVFFLSAAQLTQTGSADGPREDRMDDRRENDAPSMDSDDARSMQDDPEATAGASDDLTDLDAAALPIEAADEGVPDRSDGPAADSGESVDVSEPEPAAVVEGPAPVVDFGDSEQLSSEEGTEGHDETVAEAGAEFDASSEVDGEQDAEPEPAAADETAGEPDDAAKSQPVDVDDSSEAEGRVDLLDADEPEAARTTDRGDEDEPEPVVDASSAIASDHDAEAQAAMPEGSVAEAITDQGAASAENEPDAVEPASDGGDAEESTDSDADLGSRVAPTPDGVVVADEGASDPADDPSSVVFGSEAVADEDDPIDDFAVPVDESEDGEPAYEDAAPRAQDEPLTEPELTDDPEDSSQDAPRDGIAGDPAEDVVDPSESAVEGDQGTAGDEAGAPADGRPEVTPVDEPVVPADGDALLRGTDDVGAEHADTQVDESDASGEPEAAIDLAASADASGEPGVDGADRQEPVLTDDESVSGGVAVEEVDPIDDFDPAAEEPEDVGPVADAQGAAEHVASVQDDDGDAARASADDVSIEDPESPDEDALDEPRPDDGSSAEPVDPDSTDGEAEPAQDAEREPEQSEADPVLTGFLGDRDWTTAEELFSRPITVPRRGEDVEVEQTRDAIGESDATGSEQSASTAQEVEEQTSEAAPIDADPSVPADEQQSTADDLVAAEEQEQEPAPVVAAAVPAAAAIATRPDPKPERTSRPPRRNRPVRERFGREAVGIAVLVVLALVCGGLITAVVLKTQRDAAVAAQEAANYTPPPLATPSPTATGPVVAIIGDDTTSSAASGVSSANRWSGLLESALKGTVTTDAAAGEGYAAKSTAGDTFAQAAAKVPSNAQVVVFFGGAADSNVSALSVTKAASDAFAAAKTQAPNAKLLVVGPAISAGASSADLTAIRNSLRVSASIAKATWIDPMGDAWLDATTQAARSPSALTAADQKTLASKFEAAIKKALG